MAIANVLQPPEWINSGATITGGLDLLGLRLPVQSIGGTLLDGVTTVTPSVRYLAFRAWLIHCYGQRGGADSWQTFTDFAARVESALVLGNLLEDSSIGGLIGSDQALERLALGDAQVQIASLVKSPASTIYTGPSDQLGISRSRDNAVPALVMERGLPLAKAVDQRLTSIALIERLVRDDALGAASIDDLRELLGQGVSNLIGINPDNYFRTADQVVENLDTAFRKHQEALRDARSKKLKLYGIDVGACTVTGVVAVAAALTGDVTLGAISGALGVAGLPNLKDIKTKFKQIAAEDKARRESPTGLLFRHVTRH